MKAGRIIRIAVVWLVLGLGVSIVQSSRADTINPGSLFQYAVFYNGLLEFSDTAPLNINGPVHGNSDIYVGSPSSLTFNGYVTCSGIITNPAWFGFQRASWTGAVTYNGTPAPGKSTNTPAVNLQGVTDYRELIKPPPNGENTNNPISAQRYYNKANIVITVTDTNIILALKSSPYDVSPILLGNGPIGSPAATNWTNNTKLGFFLTTNATFYDQRENRTNQVTQIDVGLLGTWMTTNTNCLSKWPVNTSFGGIVYVQDVRATNANWMDCVRITNGVNITNGLYQSGLTVATPNPLYVWGNYDCPNPSYLLSGNTTASRPCSFVCDALTVLSSNWRDANSLSPLPSAVSTTVNAAIIAGNVPSTGSSDTQYSGGLDNLPRLLETWVGQSLRLNTSLICLYSSAQATAPFQKPGIYYLPPTRLFSFDQNFNTNSLLPPGTPLFSRTPATVTISNLNQVYDGTPRSVTATTTPAGLSTAVTYGGLTNAPSNAGSYAITATVTDPFYIGATTNLLVVSKAVAALSLTNLVQTYDGSARIVSVTVTPPGLAVTVTYNGSTIARTNVGIYAVAAMVNDANYQGTATNTLLVTPAPAPITLNNAAMTTNGSLQLSFTNVPGARFSVLAAADTSQPLTNWAVLGNVTETAPGQFQFTDGQATNLTQRFYIIRSP